MGQLVLKDNAASTLAVSLSATAGSGQTVTIAGSGAKFPTVTGTDWSHLTIFDGAGNIETMKVTAHVAGAASFTVSRGTAAGITGVTDADVKAWSAGTSTGVACRLVAQVVLDINGAATSAAASAASAASEASDAADSAAAAAVSAASAIPLTQKAAANGVASLNADGKVVQTALLADSATSATSATNVTGAATSAFALTADITPTQIAVNTNDYAPTGLATANTLRLSTDASRDLTGLTGGSDGRLMIVHNVGSNALVLKNESASSTAANRFALGGADVTLAANQSVTLQYDATSSRWRMAHTAGGAVASTAEAQALTDNTKMVTPLRLKEALQGSNQSLGTSGYQKLPGGLIIQWMKQSAASGSTAITFPMAFPTACFVVTGTLGTGAAYDWPFQVVEGTITASGCTIYRNAVQPAYIIALGH